MFEGIFTDSSTRSLALVVGGREMDAAQDAAAADFFHDCGDAFVGASNLRQGVTGDAKPEMVAAEKARDYFARGTAKGAVPRNVFRKRRRNQQRLPVRVRRGV